MTRFRTWPRCVVGVVFGLLWVGRAEAGMPSLELRDVVALRLQSISFFAVVFLAFTWIFKRSWNYLGRDFPQLPRITFRVALGVTMVCGLFFGVVLTMISGARELMTPGAWARVGGLYELRDPKRDPETWLDSARTKALEKLRSELWKHAQAHGGFLPTSRLGLTASESVWQGIAPVDSSFGYFGGLKADQGKWIVAYETDVYGPERYVLRSNGEITKTKAESLSKEIEEQMNQIYTSNTADSGSGGPSESATHR